MEPLLVPETVSRLLVLSELAVADALATRLNAAIMERICILRVVLIFHKKGSYGTVEIVLSCCYKLW